MTPDEKIKRQKTFNPSLTVPSKPVLDSLLGTPNAKWVKFERSSSDQFNLPVLKVKNAWGKETAECSKACIVVCSNPDTSKLNHCFSIEKLLQLSKNNKKKIKRPEQKQNKNVNRFYHFKCFQKMGSFSRN